MLGLWLLVGIVIGLSFGCIFGANYVRWKMRQDMQMVQYEMNRLYGKVITDQAHRIENFDEPWNIMERNYRLRHPNDLDDYDA